jgi:hypothetical protein
MWLGVERDRNNCKEGGAAIRSLDQMTVIDAVVDEEALRGPTADVVGSGEGSKRRRRRWRCHVQQIR